MGGLCCSPIILTLAWFAEQKGLPTKLGLFEVPQGKGQRNKTHRTASPHEASGPHG